jgi:hypothetical protein
MKTQHQTAILIIGICLCALCALCPPRKLADPSDIRFLIEGGNTTPEIVVPHAFLFSEDFGLFSSSARTGDNPDSRLIRYKVDVDSGRLIAELVLIASLTGIIVLIPRLKK